MTKTKLFTIATAMTPALAMAQDASSASVAAYWAAGLGIGLAASVVAFSQSRAAVAALDAIGRNPAAAKNVQLPLILSLALMEALCLFAFLITNTLAGK